MCIYIHICVSVHIYDGILLSHKKEQNWVICDVDRSRVHHTVKSVRKRTRSILYQCMYLACRKMVTDEPVCRAGIEKKTYRTELGTWQGVGKGGRGGETNGKAD